MEQAKDEPMIQVKDVSFAYRDGMILDNVSFSIRRTDFACVLGSNGTGKSTLLKLMLGLIPMQSGEIVMRGVSSVAYVSQQATGFNQDFPVTVNEVVALGAYRRGKTKRDISAALMRVGMDSYGGKLMGKLSGGQQQRVLIAKALVSEPDVVFLDEPTSGIDHRAAGDICCLLGELNKNSGLTVVMVTHDFALLSGHATKVIKLGANGKLGLFSMPSKQGRGGIDPC